MANLPLGFCFFVLLFVGSMLNVSKAKIHEYDNRKLTKIANGLYFPGESEALYASRFQNAVPASSSGTGMSFIRFDNITFVRTKEAAGKQKSKLKTSGLVETVVFEMKDKERIGGSLLNCCTSELAGAGSCNLGEVIIRRDPSEPEWPEKISTFFEEGKEEVKMAPEALVINKTGIYTVYFVTCDKDLEGIVVRGRSVWKSLGGYLPGDKAPLMYFYGFMLLAYFVLGLVWFPLVTRYWQDGFQFYNHVSLVIGFSMSELVFLFFEFYYLNTTGTSHRDDTLWVVTLASARKALSRLLLLFLSSGYGIVKPTLGGVTLRMLLAGVLCFVISEALGLATYFGNISENGMTFLMLSWAILESLFVHWIFRSLWRTLKKLKLNKRNIEKLQLYKKFARVLVIMLVLNFFWIYVEVYVYDSPSEFWQVKWIIPTFWYLLSYALLLLICFYWAPTEKPTRYLYVAEMEDELEEDGKLSMTESGMKTIDNGVENNERKTLLDIFIILFGNLPRDEYENPT